MSSEDGKGVYVGVHLCISVVWMFVPLHACSQIYFCSYTVYVFVHDVWLYAMWQMAAPCEDLERSGEQGTDVFLSWKMAAESLQSEQ